MLVLTRNETEAIRIGDKIIVTVIRIGTDKVKLGIDAPPTIPVHRQEVYEAIQREAKAAQPGSPARVEACVNAELLEALHCMVIGACAVAVPNPGERACLHEAVTIARAAIAKAESTAPRQREGS